MKHHTNNWAVLVCTSTFWFNYRHIANVLSVYHIIKEQGITDDHIILMLPDDMACNPRNPLSATVFNHWDHSLNVYDDRVKVDYRGSEVTVDNFIRLLTNRLESDAPRSKRLLSDKNSNILIYMTGHGGDNFLKFQDSEEINAHDLAHAFAQMHEQERYNQIMFLVDTCQAATLGEQISAPAITTISSSIKGESSYSYQVDRELGVAVLDRFTWSLLKFTKNYNMHSTITDNVDDTTVAPHSIRDLFDALDPAFLQSTPHIRQSHSSPDPLNMKFSDFFASTKHPSDSCQYQKILFADHPIADIAHEKGSFTITHEASFKSTFSTEPKNIKSISFDYISLIPIAIFILLVFNSLIKSFWPTHSSITKHKQK